MPQRILLAAPMSGQSAAPAPRLLVVEDDHDIAHLLSHSLGRAGFAVDLLHSGAEVLPAVRRSLPDLVLLDLMLPGLDGLEVCRTLRGDPRTAAVPIIMLTARAEESDRIVGLELGADDYITKPFSPNEVVARVRALLRRAHRDQPAGPAALRPAHRRRRAAHRVGRRRRGAADGQGIPAAAVSARAPGPRAVARSPALRRVGLRLHRAARARWTSTCGGCARNCR